MLEVGVVAEGRGTPKGRGASGGGRGIPKTARGGAGTSKTPRRSPRPADTGGSASYNRGRTAADRAGQDRRTGRTGVPRDGAPGDGPRSGARTPAADGARRGPRTTPGDGPRRGPRTSAGDGPRRSGRPASSEGRPSADGSKRLPGRSFGAGARASAPSTRSFRRDTPPRAQEGEAGESTGFERRTERGPGRGPRTRPGESGYRR